jgi:ribosomal protein S18 acetylase RimI-like enzyme
VIVRNGSLQDAAEFARLDALCFTPEIRYPESAFQYYLLHPGHLTAVAQDNNGKMSGFAICQLADEKGGTAHLVTIDVHPDRRRQQVGTRLFSWLDKKFVEKGLKKMVLEVYSHNLGAIAFYRRHGFNATKTLPDYYGRGKDAVLMSRNPSDPGR